MSDESIHHILEKLPKSSMTTRVLGVLDYVVPGEWKNVTSFEGMIQEVTGEDDQALIQRVGERAIALYKDPEQGYQRAVQIYRLIDDTGGIAGAVSLANKVGHSFEWLSFLETITPKADSTQAVDAGLKLVGELAAFCYCNGIPGDSVGDFASSLASYEKDDAIRLAAWVTFDGLIPLGPDFLWRTIQFVENFSNDDLAEHGRFARLLSLLPGGGVDEQRKLIKTNLEASATAISGFVESKGIQQQGALDRLKEVLQVADDKLDYVAAAIDLTTNYFEHTGIQSVARRLISRAYGEI
jgi:hypothetical protein